MPTETKTEVPVDVQFSKFGCVNCLWQAIECQEGGRYQPKPPEGCENYTYYD